MPWEDAIRQTLLIFGLLICAMASMGEETDKRDNWYFFGSIVYSSRSLDGVIVSKNAIADGVYGDMVTTGDAMGVDNSNAAMLAFGVQYKRFGFGLNYMPTSFKGTGSALVGGSGTNVGIYAETPLETDINVNMLLANVYYNLIQTQDTVLGLGAGLGQTMVDLSIVPETGTALTYDGNTPFGFLNLHFKSRYKRFLYGFVLNGLSLDVEDANIVYSDYKVDVGYRIFDGRAKVDIVGGYRLVNFAIDMEGNSSEIAVDVSLEGPFLGLAATF